MSLTSIKDLVDVAFEFFDPNPKVDYHAIKRLVSQLFQRDSENLNMHELTELVLSQPTVGTTIKTDGIESDPYALLTVLNMHLHHVYILIFLIQTFRWLTFIFLKQNVAMKAIANYLMAITSTHDPKLHSTLKTLFSQSESHVGLVICERLVNMPVQVVPPMYRMLADEVKRALADVSTSRLYSLLTNTSSQYVERIVLFYASYYCFSSLSPF